MSDFPVVPYLQGIHIGEPGQLVILIFHQLRSYTICIGIIVALTVSRVEVMAFLELLQVGIIVVLTVSRVEVTAFLELLQVGIIVVLTVSRVEVTAFLELLPESPIVSWSSLPSL